MRRITTFALCAAASLILLGCSGQGVGLASNNNSDGGVIDPDANQCGVGDDEKMLPGAGTMKIFHGTAEPEYCMAKQQQEAVGALLFEDSGWSNGCTGTLIADDVVLTAAHCVESNSGSGTIDPDQVRFAVGINSADPDHIFQVQAVYANPAYQGEAPHDHGLLKLSQGISAAGLDIIPIPSNIDVLQNSFVGAKVQNVGYGDTHEQGDNSYRWWTTEPVTELQNGEFQVYGGGGPNGSSVCYGDSGGPSLYLFPDNRLRVVGTVSWGDWDCMSYDYFARTDDNRGWIESSVGVIDQCGGLTATGVCSDDVAIWCENGAQRQDCCAENGQACGTDAAGNQRCTGDRPPLVCEGGLTFEGECQGDTAVWCLNGYVQSRRCDRCDQLCGYVSPEVGYYCQDGI